MAIERNGAPNGLRFAVLALSAAVAAVIITSKGADARHHRWVRVHYVHVERHGGGAVHRHASAEEYSPPTASILVDGNTGQVLEQSNPDALRHPASLTKIMTLYLLFERLDAGKIKLDSQLRVSDHAADQDPTKLELKPGQTIAVEDAIKGVVTRSANDAAVVIAENLGGSESDFAKLMTQKARALGMSHTTYVNASGLPDDDQITSARDQATLGRAIQERFPRYYKYFSLPSFVYRGVTIRNHDHLLGEVDGVDGIKTGFTRASGFNLVTSVHRDGRFVVGVVLGGRSAFQRDAHMRELIGAHIKEASLHRTAPAIAEDTTQQPLPAPVTKAQIAARSDAAPTATPPAVRVAAGSTDPLQPLLVKTVSYKTAQAQTAALPTLTPALASAAAQPAPVVQAAVALPPPVVAPPVAAAPRTVAAAPRTVVASAVEAPPALPPVMAKPDPAKPDPVQAADLAMTAPAFADPEPARAEAPPQMHARGGGWVIQIGAYPAEDDAKQHLSAAQAKVRDHRLAAADPFTERVLKGDKAYYRARFAGFDRATAEATCKQLKRNDFDCITVRD
jgi:D-alanyl-D-alanine carboxypeptidase